MQCAFQILSCTLDVIWQVVGCTENNGGNEMSQLKKKLIFDAMLTVLLVFEMFFELTGDSCTK